MKVLVCSWGNICEPDLILGLEAMGHDVDVIKEKIDNKDYDVNYLNLLSNELLKASYDCVFSINFIPIISRVCHTFRIKYISWIVDSPWFQLNSKTLAYPCNYVFIFDKILYEKFKDKSNQIYHMPLGANTRFWDKISVSKEDEKRFSVDVSFVGSLYEDKHDYDKVPISDYLKGYFAAIMEVQSQLVGYNFMNEVVEDAKIEEFVEAANFTGVGYDYHVSEREIVLTEFLGKKCAEIERTRTVCALAKKFNFDLYTLSKTEHLPFIHNKGPADSRFDMPKVFKCSKININMTIKTIESGIPQRVFDIMGNGGFVITNFQSELLDYFVPGEDLVIYENLDDLLFKVAYYLEHEEERKRIAQNGYEKVKALYTVEKRLEDILYTVWKDRLKVCGVNDSQSAAKSNAFIHLLKQLKVNKVLDVGLFLGRNKDNESIKNGELSGFEIDGVELIVKCKSYDLGNIYSKIYQVNHIAPQKYDIIFMLDIVKMIEEKDLIIVIQYLLNFSQIFIFDYDDKLEQLLNLERCDIQKLSIGDFEFMLVVFG